MITSAEEFYNLRTSTEPRLYHRAAHDTAPPDVWLAVIEQYPDMRFWVAQNKTVSVEILDVLSHDADARTRLMVARKRKLPPSVQQRLAHGSDPAVRCALAYNAKVDGRVLAVLANDSDDDVREAAERRQAAKTD